MCGDRFLATPIAVTSTDAFVRRLQAGIEDLRQECVSRERPAHYKSTPLTRAFLIQYAFLDHVDSTTGSTTVRALSFVRDFQARLEAFERDIDRHLLMIGHNFTQQGQDDLNRMAGQRAGGAGSNSRSPVPSPGVRVLRR